MKNNFLLETLYVINNARAIHGDAERREGFARYGVTAIIFSLLALAFSAVAGFLFNYASDVTALSIIMIVLIAVLICCATAMLAGALVRVIGQIIVNRNPISWVALGVFCACAVGSIVVIVLLAVL